MTSVSDSEDIYDDTFDFFQNCGKLYLESRNACKTLAIDTSQSEGEENSKNCDLKKANICPLKDIAPYTPLDNNEVEAVPAPAKSCMISVSESSKKSTRIKRKKRSPDVILISADPSPPRKGRRGRKGRKSQCLPDPILIEDSDAECTGGLNNSVENLNMSLPDDNYEISVKVWWRFGKIHKFPIRKHQKLSSLFAFFSDLERVPQEQILLTLHDTVNIKPNDTPDILKLNIADVIEGGITTYKINEHQAQSKAALQVDKNSIQLKLLIKDRKEPLLVYTQKDQNMQTVMTKCAEQLDLPLNKLRFTLDGDTLQPKETPEDLDLEGGECIEVQIAK